MKNKILRSFVAVIMLLSTPLTHFAQAINLGTAANFVLFTTVGAIGNTGQSQITGDVGTNSGGTTGFGNVNGVMHSGDGATASATNNLLSAYNQLNSAIPTATHAPLLGNGEILTPGVYDISGVTVVSNILTLDAKGDANAVFIFKISAALSSTTAAQIKLINGALACKVFWKVEGAVTLGALTSMKGNVVAHNDFIDLSTGVELEGRLLSINGAVTVNGVKAKTPVGCGSTVLSGPAAPNLGSSICYAIFSGNESVSNSGISTVKGDIGTNVGLTTGYDELLVDGMIHPIPDASTNAAAAALLNARTYLNALTADIELLYPAQFGKGLTLTPHTYVLNGGTSFTDTLFLDGEGNDNAVFVIKIYGALTTGSMATVKLINGTQAKNVYWIVNGAVSISTGSNIAGTFISNNGAISLSTGVQLAGRAMTTNGALTTAAVNVTMTEGCTTLPLSLISFTGKMQRNEVLLSWKTINEQNTAMFQVEQSFDGKTYAAIGNVAAAGTSVSERAYAFTGNISAVASPTVYYRLKMLDVDGKFTYSTVVSLPLQAKATQVSLYPNPSKTAATLTITTLQKERINYSIFDHAGRIVSTVQTNLLPGANTLRLPATTLAPGVYTVRITGLYTNENIRFVKQ